MPVKTLLITGATGFLGGAALAQLLTGRPPVRVLALVRADSVARGLDRLAERLARFEVELDRTAVEVLPGDLEDTANMSDTRLDQVTHVLHAAANTSFRSVRNVRRVNILGTLALAHRMRRTPVLQRFLHVGTAYCCGQVDDGQVLQEDDYPRDDATHAVEYSQSKAEAERLLSLTAPELPLVIARPSVIVGHSRLGCAPSASLFWFYRTADLLRRITTSPEAREDILPVDYVAQALLTLLFKPALQFRKYHVSAGLRSSCSWTEIAAAFARHTGHDGHEPYLTMAPEDILAERHRLADRLGPGNEDRLLMALGLYYRFPTVVFDNSRLLAEGMAPPPRFVDYLDLCMKDADKRSVYAQMQDDG